ncbi:MAG: hypothetical protein ABSH41_26910, partial [Syntrophobacteraceae bacterium]
RLLTSRLTAVPLTAATGHGCEGWGREAHGPPVPVSGHKMLTGYCKSSNTRVKVSRFQFSMKPTGRGWKRAIGKGNALL